MHATDLRDLRLACSCADATCAAIFSCFDYNGLACAAAPAPEPEPPPSPEQVDPCAAAPAECDEPHPAAVCVLPACDFDDNTALLALPHADKFMSRLSFQFCVDCACLAANGLCAELRPGLPALDSVCGCSCAPPRTVAQRGCVAAALPTPAWPDSAIGQADTPALEYPSIFDVCHAGGMDVVISRTADWLDLALRYKQQAASGNAGVIVQHICLERRFESLVCLNSVAASCADTDGWTSTAGDHSCDQYASREKAHCAEDTGSDGRTAAQACPVACGTCSAHSSTLTDMIGQACELAQSIGRGGGIEALLLSTDVYPLTFDVYHQHIEGIDTFVGSLVQARDQLRQEDDLRAMLARQTSTTGASAVDESQLWQTRMDEDTERMTQFRTQITTIDGTIQQLLLSMSVDGPALLGSVSSQINASHQAMQHAMGTSGLRPEERLWLQNQLQRLDTQIESKRGQLDGRRRLAEAEGGGGGLDIAWLQQQLQALLQQRGAAQDQLDDPMQQGAPAPGYPSCDASCATDTPPSTNGCGNDFTGSFHSWAMTMAQELTGCTMVPHLWNDVTPCCDTHDFCYGTCGMTEGFCDKQLTDCMRAKTNLPACQTVINATGLLVDVVGCSHFKPAQDACVQPQCHNTEPPDNPGCTQPLGDVRSALRTGKNICDTVGAIAAAIVANPVGNAVCNGIDAAGVLVGAPGICHGALAAVTRVSAAASKAMSFLEDSYNKFSSFISSFRRLAEAQCGDQDGADCQSLRQEIIALGQKMNAAQALIATAASLMSLNEQLTSQSLDGVDSTTTLPKLDMRFLDLDMLNDEVLLESFRSALGSDGEQTYETEIRQLVTLLRNKLQQMRSFYEAALSKHSNQQQRDLLARRGQRAESLVAEELDEAAQLQTTVAFFDAKIRGYCYLSLQYLVQEKRAYEYMFLTESTALDLTQLQAAPMESDAYRQFVNEAGTHIQSEFLRAASLFNNAGTQMDAGVAFELSELPTAKENFVQSGQITLSIPLPAESNWYGVVFSDVRVFLVGLPVSGRTPITIEAVKAGVSDFKDQNGDVRRFTHDESNPPLSFTYDADRCKVLSSSDGQLQSGNMQDIYIRYSPYGTWRLQVTNWASLQLEAVTAVYFEFELQAKPGHFSGVPDQNPNDSFFTGGSFGALDAAACGGGAAPPPTPTPGGGGSVVCDTSGDFTARAAELTAECCDEPTETCTGGYPSTCNAGCAAVLLPIRDSCSAGFLSPAPLASLAAILNTAASMCAGGGH